MAETQKTPDRKGCDKPTPFTTHRPVPLISVSDRVDLEMGMGMKQPRRHRRAKGVEKMRKRILAVALVGLLLAPLAFAEEAGGLPPAEEEIAALEQVYDQVVSYFGSLIAELKGAVQALNASDQDHAARYQALVAELKDVEAKIGQLQEMCAQVPQLAGRLQALEARLADEVATLKSDVEKKLGVLADDLTSQLSDHEARISALEKQDMGSLQRRILALEQASQALQVKIENNRAKLAGFEAALGGFTADIQANKDAIALLQTRVNDHDDRIATLEAQVEGLDIQAMQDALGAAQGMALLALLAGIGTIVLYLMQG